MHQTATLSDALQSVSRTLPANVGELERAMSALAGVAMLGYAWKRGSTSLAVMSTGLVLRGVTGYCPAYAALDVDHTARAVRAVRPQQQIEADPINPRAAARIEGV